MRQYYVYILSSRSRQVYVGVTSDLLARLSQHRQGLHGFTSRYRICRLVYYEIATQPIVAIAREKQNQRLSTLQEGRAHYGAQSRLE